MRPSRRRSSSPPGRSTITDEGVRASGAWGRCGGGLRRAHASGGDRQRLLLAPGGERAISACILHIARVPPTQRPQDPQANAGRKAAERPTITAGDLQRVRRALPHLLARLEEADLRVLLLRPLQAPGVARQEDRQPVVVLGRCAPSCASRNSSASRWSSASTQRAVWRRRALEAHRDVVLGADAVGEHVELQRAGDADDPVGADARAGRPAPRPPRRAAAAPGPGAWRASGRSGAPSAAARARSSGCR